MDLKVLSETPPWEWPKGTGKLLAKVLRDKRADASDRLIAAGLAGDYVVINDELADILLSILRTSDESEKMRSRAAISFGAALESADIDEFDEPESVPITEPMFHRIQRDLRSLYLDTSIPKLVRRRILEASVRAPEDWHPMAILAAYDSADRDWRLTAVFSMRYVRGGFDDQILEALNSSDPEIHIEAVRAAGVAGVDRAWEHILALVTSKKTEKELLIAAIAAISGIRAWEAPEVLDELADSDDEDIAEAVEEALLMAGAQDFDEDAAIKELEEEEEEGGTGWVN
jgi:hypothetical protein